MSSLSVPVVREGAAIGEITLALDPGRLEALTLSGARLSPRRGGVVAFSTGTLDHIYLSTDPAASFALVPPTTALPLRCGERARVRVEGGCVGEVSLWVIEYDDEQRLAHVRAALDSAGGTLDVTLTPRTTRLRVAVRCRGEGTLTLRSLSLEPLPLPPALTAVRGAFVSVGAGVRSPSSAASELPPATPDVLPAPALPVADTTALDRDERAPIDFFLTVDTEDAYFTEPRLMTGAGLGREWGVYGILDALDAHAVHGTFFVNVFEAARQPPRAVASVVRDIAARGHEVALHTHPSPDLPWYDRPLFRQSLAEQVEILRRGREMLEEWSGEAVVSFRAGGYAINDDTLAALPEAGLRIDSSVFFPSPNNRNSRFTVNAPRIAGGLIEVPVTYVIRSSSEGQGLEHRKLDLDWLTPDQLWDALGRLRLARAPVAMFMMHSFSFLEKASLPPEQPPSSTALFRSDTLFNRYVEIYGPKPAAREAFEALLDGLARDRQIRVRTLREAEDDLRRIAAQRPPDIVPVVPRDGTRA